MEVGKIDDVVHVAFEGKVEANVLIVLVFQPQVADVPLSHAEVNVFDGVNVVVVVVGSMPRSIAVTTFPLDEPVLVRGGGRPGSNFDVLDVDEEPPIAGLELNVFWVSCVNVRVGKSVSVPLVLPLCESDAEAVVARVEEMLEGEEESTDDEPRCKAGGPAGGDIDEDTVEVDEVDVVDVDVDVGSCNAGGPAGFTIDAEEDEVDVVDVDVDVDVDVGSCNAGGPAGGPAGSTIDAEEEDEESVEADEVDVVDVGSCNAGGPAGFTIDAEEDEGDTVEVDEVDVVDVDVGSCSAGGPAGFTIEAEEEDVDNDSEDESSDPSLRLIAPGSPSAISEITTEVVVGAVEDDVDVVSSNAGGPTGGITTASEEDVEVLVDDEVDEVDELAAVVRCKGGGPAGGPFGGVGGVGGVTELELKLCVPDEAAGIDSGSNICLRPNLPIQGSGQSIRLCLQKRSMSRLIWQISPLAEPTAARLDNAAKESSAKSAATILTDPSAGDGPDKIQR